MLSWSRTQTVVALSSAEAEYHALVTGAQEGLFAKSLFGELGFDAAVEIASDARAALASAERAGLGHKKHMELRLMFLKDLVKNKVLRLVQLRSVRRKPSRHVD